MLGPDGSGSDVMMGIVLPYFQLMNAGASVGTMEAATTKVAAHVGEARLQHVGQSLADLPTIRAYIARMRIKTDLVRALLLGTIDALENGRADAMLRVLEVKAAAGESATEVTDLAMRVCGGAAFRKEMGVERHFRDARAATVMAPTYDCNLRCSYCVAKSSPNAPRRAIGFANVCRLVDEAVALGFTDVFFTGGEPFILNDIYDMLAYASARLKTTVLTNAMILRGARLEKLAAVANDNLIVQVSLDGGCAEHHDAYRGAGAWAKTVEGIRLLQERGFRVRLSTTETPANTAHLEQICAFHHALGIPDEDHFIRPLAKRGYSKEGLELGMANLVPELTVNLDGVFWHPLSTDADMQVSKRVFPLATVYERVKRQLETMARTGAVPLMTFT